MPQVTIISEEQIPQYRPDGTVNIMIAVTYIAPNMPPRTVWIDKTKFSPQILAQAIRADMEQAKAAAPKTIEI